jgi:endonuclease/exonuclease/phosphatase family metal-dependent hydrolase
MTRHAYLREMVQLVTQDGPDVVCLQEIPVWALPHLERWSGMQCVGAVARRPLLPFLGRWITELHHGRIRSAFVGEADAILVARSYRLSDARTAVVSERGDNLRRIVHGVRLDGGIYIVNVHIDGKHLPGVAEFVDGEARVIVAGDFNVEGKGLPGYSAPLPKSVDQIVVRGLPCKSLAKWSLDRHRRHGQVLSDHSPVELHVE